ncbi:MAG: tetratricopeptide repeat protein [Candidatus Eisenbacteria bacterium]|uniref:Tetratricopeptide repeat protein n=1 Tax=Eiseniibacteriota bacterium TaxID=2212470 RepID=A0A538TM33_UNCEI|nr:MAG: tetratricopeptide repeat protein [Candidatus Eisenbacteria bacterium]
MIRQVKSNGRPPRSLAPLLLALLSLSASFLIGCSGGPKPAQGTGAASRPGAAGKAKVWRPAGHDTLGPTLAIVGGRRITRHDVDSLIATAPPSAQSQLRDPDGYRDVVKRMVVQEAVYNAAVRAGLERDSSYLAQVKLSSRDLLMRRFYEMKIQALPAIEDSGLKTYYEAHQQEFAIHARAKVRHIVVPTRAKALEIRRALEKGALWDQTCAKYSTDKATKGDGGLIGWVAKDSDLVPGIGKAPAIVAAAYSLPIDQISQPLQGVSGWHLIRVETREDETVQPFEATKSRIATRLKSEQREKYGKTFTDSLLQSSATIFDDSIKVALKPSKTAEDYFKEAQAAVTPLQRIELYKELVKRYPDEKVSIQAQFMIGFTYAEEMGEYDLARREFEEFLRVHPDSELAGSAKWMIENMGLPGPDLKDDDSGGEGGTSAGPDSGRAGPGGSK